MANEREKWNVVEKDKTEQALIVLKKMFEKWGLGHKDWVIVDEIAFVLQGFEVVAEEIKSGHLDAYVNIARLPWQPSRERSIIPPVKSNYFADYCRFMETTGFGLDMLATAPDEAILKQPMVDYKLPNGERVQLMEVVAMTRQFWQRTLMHYSPTEVAPEKVKEWLAKLELIREVALEKEEAQLAKECGQMLVEARKKWAKVLGS